MKKLKRLSIFIVIGIFIFTTEIPKTHAQVGVVSAPVLESIAAAQSAIQAENATQNTAQMIKEYGIDTLVTVLQNRILNKLIDDAVNWANGGFDGDPGFLKNWDTFLDGTKHDVIANTFHLATKVARQTTKSYQQGGEGYKQCREKQITRANDTYDRVYKQCCGKDLACEDLGKEDESLRCEKKATKEWKRIMGFCDRQAEALGDLSNIAEENYKAYMSTGLVEKRAIAKTVAKFGAAELNSDPVTDLINGQGNTLAYILGSQPKVDNFKNDFSVGGWLGYMALSDPHNYPTGLNSLVEGALGSKTSKTVQSAIDEKQTPQRFEDKRKCVEWSKNNKDKHGNKINRVCLRYETQTPGALVETKVKKAFTKDEDQSYLARELSDVIARALGRLTDGLLQAGLNNLSKAMHGKSATQALQEKINKEFSSAYQNAYDVLGVVDDARVFNQNNAGGGNAAGSSGTTQGLFNNNFQKGAGNDASTPYVGGPEDREDNVNWNSGPELIIELKGNLEKSYNLAKEIIKYKIQTKEVKNSLMSILPDYDRCLPGPDYGWEDRFRQKAQDLIMGVEGQYGSCDAIRNNFQEHFEGNEFSRSKQIAYDPKLNIPGAQKMRVTLQSILSGNNYSFLKGSSLKEKNDLLTLLGGMKNDARSINGFKRARNALNPKIPLFMSDMYTTGLDGNGNVIQISKISDQDLIDILSIHSSDAYAQLENIASQNNQHGSSQAQNQQGGNQNQQNGSQIQNPQQGGSQQQNNNLNNSTLHGGRGGNSQNNNLSNTRNNTISVATQIYNFLTAKTAFAAQQTTNATPQGLAPTLVPIPTYYIEAEGLYSFKNGETPEELVHKNREKAEQLAIDLGWHLWRKYADKKEKSNLRYKYYLIKNKLVTEKDVLEAKLEFDGATKLKTNIQGIYHDCTVFKNKVLDEHMTNQQIRNFLLGENEKKQLNQPSVFITDTFTSPEEIEQSILSFHNISDLKKYMDTMYPGHHNYVARLRIYGKSHTYTNPLTGKTYVGGIEVAGLFNDNSYAVSQSIANDNKLPVESIVVPVLFCDIEERDGINPNLQNWANMDATDKCGDSYKPENYKKICAGGSKSWYRTGAATYIAAMNDL